MVVLPSSNATGSCLSGNLVGLTFDSSRTPLAGLEEVAFVVALGDLGICDLSQDFVFSAAEGPGEVAEVQAGEALPRDGLP